jgi:hypothetical protein
MASIMSTAQRVLQAGQVRADRELRSIEVRNLGKHWTAEVGDLRGLVRNLCAELAAFERPDGYIEVWWNAQPFSVCVKDELIEVNGFDITKLLDKDVKAAVLNAAREKKRDDDLQRAEEVRADRWAA